MWNWSSLVKKKSTGIFKHLNRCLTGCHLVAQSILFPCFNLTVYLFTINDAVKHIHELCAFTIVSIIVKILLIDFTSAQRSRDWVWNETVFIQITSQDLRDIWYINRLSNYCARVGLSTSHFQDGVPKSHVFFHLNWATCNFLWQQNSK